AITILNLRKAHGLWQIGLLFFLEGIYVTAYALELVSSSLEMKVLFNHIQYIAIPFIAPIWFLIAMKFRRHDRNPQWWVTLLVLTVPALTMLAVQFTYYTDFNLYYTFNAIYAGTPGTLGMDVLVLGKGPLYYLFTAYDVLILAMIGTVYILSAVRTNGNKRRQAWTLAVFALTTAVLCSFPFFSTETSGLDLVLYGIAGISYIVLYSMFRFEFFTLTPSAHQATFEKSTDPIMIIDEHFEIISWNAAVEQFGIGDKQYRIPIRESFLPEEVVESVRAGETTEFEHHDKRFILETIPLTTKRGHHSGYIIRFNDMTSYLDRMEKLDYEASHDSLTDIYNRRAFGEAASAYINQTGSSGEPFAVLMIDIDDFKTINDTMGHPSGDVILEGLAHLMESVKPANAILARYGGEEFVMLLPTTQAEKARFIAEGLRTAVEHNDFPIGDQIAHIRISIGVKAAKTDAGLTIKDMIKGADEALYISKNSGKNVVTTVL
ncbi:MAG: diguanylate cyclase, partial [bacterium]